MILVLGAIDRLERMGWDKRLVTGEEEGGGAGVEAELSLLPQGLDGLEGDGLGDCLCLEGGYSGRGGVDSRWLWPCGGLHW